MHIKTIITFLMFTCFLFMMKLHVFAISGEERVIPGEVDEMCGVCSSVEISKLYLIKTSGTIRIEGSSQEEDFEVYFHVPIPFEEQRPVSVEIQCPNLVDYRFISHILRIYW